MYSSAKFSFAAYIKHRKNWRHKVSIKASAVSHPTPSKSKRLTRRRPRKYSESFLILCFQCLFCLTHKLSDVSSLAYNLRGTVKAAVPEGVPLLPFLVAVSIYDTNPVHFLLMTYMSIVWITKTRMVFDQETGFIHPMNFLRLNFNDGYNKKMNDVDISNQLRNQYCINHCIWKYKWWWDLFFLCHGVMIVHSCVLYKSIFIRKVRKPLSNYWFQNQVVLANLDPAN